MDHKIMIEQLMDDISEIHRQIREKIYCISHNIYYTTHMLNDRITYISENQKQGYCKWLAAMIEEYTEYLKYGDTKGCVLCFEEWLGHSLLVSVTTLKEMKCKIRRLKYPVSYKSLDMIRQASHKLTKRFRSVIQTIKT